MENQLTQEQSLKIISEMIQQAKKNYTRGGSFYFLLWGWTVMVANFAHYFLQEFTSFEYPFMVWIITIPAAVITFFFRKQIHKNSRVTSHLDRIYGQVWAAISIGIVFSLVFMSKIEYNHTAIIMLLAGIGTYVTGRMLRFNPLVIGGVFLWIISLTCFFLSIPEQYLAGGIGIIGGYLIPGYMLKAQEK